MRKNFPDDRSPNYSISVIGTFNMQEWLLAIGNFCQNAKDITTANFYIFSIAGRFQEEKIISALWNSAISLGYTKAFIVKYDDKFNAAYDSGFRRIKDKLYMKETAISKGVKNYVEGIRKGNQHSVNVSGGGRGEFSGGQGDESGPRQLEIEN